MNSIKMSSTQAKLQFGSLSNKLKAGKSIIVEINNNPQFVLISLDDYEDYLELEDRKFQQDIEKQKQEIPKGNFGNINDLYTIHQETIRKEAEQ